MSRALLASRFKNTDYVQVTVHTGGLGADQLQSYTFLVLCKAWSHSRAQRGNLVLFTLRGERIPGADRYWSCTEVRLAS